LFSVYDRANVRTYNPQVDVFLVSCWLKATALVTALMLIIVCFQQYPDILTETYTTEVY